jgi:hypothetical protein
MQRRLFQHKHTGDNCTSKSSFPIFTPASFSWGWGTRNDAAFVMENSELGLTLRSVVVSSWFDLLFDRIFITDRPNSCYFGPLGNIDILLI